MTLSQYVESYRFWEVVTQWARERLEHEHIVARVLAKGVLREGLRVNSVDPRWASVGTFELRGAPMLGYVARQGDLRIFIRTVALAHLTSIVEKAGPPEPDFLRDEFISKQDLYAWLIRSHILPPSFWFDTPPQIKADILIRSPR